MLLLLLLSHFSHVWFCVTPQTAAHQAPPSLGFSRQEHWSGLPFPSPMHESEKWKWSRSVVSDSSRPHGLQPTRLLRPWDFPGKSTGVGCYCLLGLTLISPLNNLSSFSPILEWSNLLGSNFCWHLLVSCPLPWPDFWELGLNHVGVRVCKRKMRKRVCVMNYSPLLA